MRRGSQRSASISSEGAPAGLESLRVGAVCGFGGLGFRVVGFWGFRALGCRSWGVGFRVLDFELRVWDLAFAWFRISVSGFKTHSKKILGSGSGPHMRTALVGVIMGRCSVGTAAVWALILQYYEPSLCP